MLRKRHNIYNTRTTAIADKLSCSFRRKLYEKKTTVACFVSVLFLQYKFNCNKINDQVNNGDLIEIESL